VTVAQPEFAEMRVPLPARHLDARSGAAHDKNPYAAARVSSRCVRRERQTASAHVSLASHKARPLPSQKSSEIQIARAAIPVRSRALWPRATNRDKGRAPHPSHPPRAAEESAA